MADEPKRPDSTTTSNQPESAPAEVDDSPDTTVEEMQNWFGVLTRKGLPLKNQFWQTVVHHVRSFAWPVGFKGRYLRELAGSYYNLTGYNVYFDWVFLISDSPIEEEELTPSTNKSKVVCLGHGEFVTHIRHDDTGYSLWVYTEALTKKWGTRANIQQFVIDTGEHPPPRLERYILVGPVHNTLQLFSRCVHPSECDPDLLDPAERDSPVGRLLVMRMKNGPTIEQADRVVESLLEMEDLEKQNSYLALAQLAVACYRDIREVLQQKLEEAMQKMEQVTITIPGQVTDPDQYPIEPEELEAYESFLEKFYPDALLRQTRWVREAEKKATEKAAKRTASLRASDRVDTLVSLLRRCDAELHPDEVAELIARPLDQLPSVDSTLDVKTREEFLELAKLNGHGGPPTDGADSDD